MQKEISAKCTPGSNHRAPCFPSLQTSVQLNRRILSELAITEPRTFLSLAKLAQARREEGFRAALGDGQEPAGVFSRVMVTH